MKLDERCLDAEFCVGCDSVLVSIRFSGILVGVTTGARLFVADMAMELGGVVVVMVGEL